VVDGVLAYLSLYSGGTSEVRELREDAVDCCTTTDDTHSLDQRAGGWAGADNDVTLSSRWLFLQSTKKPKWDRKSAPMKDCLTSATTNRHLKSQRNPSLKLRGAIRRWGW
jgi:hypothetical protein